jgi:hypothetical protein
VEAVVLDIEGVPAEAAPVREETWTSLTAVAGGETVRSSVCEAGATVVMSVGESVSEVDLEGA